MALDDEFLADLDELSSEEHDQDEGDMAHAMDADQVLLAAAAWQAGLHGAHLLMHLATAGG
jgi:hypothetical protein